MPLVYTSERRIARETLVFWDSSAFPVTCCRFCALENPRVRWVSPAPSARREHPAALHHVPRSRLRITRWPVDVAGKIAPFYCGSSKNSKKTVRHDCIFFGMVYCKKHNIWKILIVLTQYIVTRMKIIKTVDFCNIKKIRYYIIFAYIRALMSRHMKRIYAVFVIIF